MLVARLAVVPSVLRQHWLASALIAAGAVLRVLTEMAYHPAIVYIDSLKYIYGFWPGADPVAYKIPWKFLQAFGGTLGTMEFLQHLLGIAMAVTIYFVLLRRGAPRWVSAIAMAPLLLDAYQLQAETMIMPDVWFEALIVAGAAVLLWKPRLEIKFAVVGAFILGASTGFRQVGEILIVPLIVFAIVMGGDWRRMLTNVVAVTAAFAVAIVCYLGASYALTKHFWISRSSVSLTYGRMAAVVDCSTLRIPAIEKPLCPTKAQQAQGADWMEHYKTAPYRSFASTLPPNLVGQANTYVSRFNRAVETQQPLRVLSGIVRDSVKLFALTRHTSPGDTPLWRWQFQGNFPSYLPNVIVKGNAILIQSPPSGPLHQVSIKKLNPDLGGPPQVDHSIASFLRGYQLGGGYTPGPAYLLFVITGLLGSLLLIARRRLTSASRQVALACLLFFVTGVAVLVASDFFQFTWRYQLPALVTLPPAGMLGIWVLIRALRKPGEPVSAETLSGRAPELATPAS